MEGEELNLRQWAHDAFALALPAQVLCRPDCAGLCPDCGADLNRELGHTHGPKIDPRWAKPGELEREVFLGVISGKLNKQIAVDLGTVEKTIKVHRARVMEKMGADSLAELVRIAGKAGIVGA